MFRKLVNRVRAPANWLGAGLAKDDVWSSVAAMLPGLLAKKSVLAGRRIDSFTEPIPFFFILIVKKCQTTALAIMTLLSMLMAGTVHADHTLTNSDFTDNGDGTVTHSLTGLTWMRCSMGQAWTGSNCDGTASSYYLEQATALSLTFADESDWRLPSIQELQSIVDDAFNPTINRTAFPNTPGSYFWSSSPVPLISQYAWGVDFSSGHPNSYHPFSTLSVRLVRGGRSLVPSPTTFTIAVTRSGSGTITSSPGGINCGADCQEVFRNGTSVTLTATPATGSVFTGWSGTYSGTYSTTTSSPSGIVCASDCMEAYNSGTVTISAASNLTANFAPTTFTIAVTRSGSGTITSSPGGINCGADCQEVFRNGTSVTLTATPATGSAFTGWSGTYSGTYSTTTSSPSGIVCASDCMEAYRSGTITISAASNLTANYLMVSQNTAEDCLFDWAEDTNPTLFLPSRVTTQTFGGYRLRHYTSTNTYLGISSTSGRLIYYAPQSSINALLDLGLAATWTTQAGCSP